MSVAGSVAGVSTSSTNEMPCVLCDRSDSQAVLKCCEHFLCFKCYNKMARSGRTIVCPHCRSNPLQFYDDEDNSTVRTSGSRYEPEHDPGMNPNIHPQSLPGRIVYTFYSLRPEDPLGPNGPGGLNGQDLRSPDNLSSKIILGIRTGFLLLQFLLYYLLPPWTVTTFFVGFLIAIFDIGFLCEAVFYPLNYSFYIHKDYIKNSIYWKYIKKLDLFENRI